MYAVFQSENRNKNKTIIAVSNPIFGHIEFIEAGTEKKAKANKSDRKRDRKNRWR